MRDWYGVVGGLGWGEEEDGGVVGDGADRADTGEEEGQFEMWVLGSAVSLRSNMVIANGQKLLK